MTKSPQNDTAASYTAQPLYDGNTLGRTSGQRTAEIFAGLRAEMLPSPETLALSRMSGRIIARLLMRLGKPQLFNFVPVRLGGFTGLIRQALPQNGENALLVELAAGFSPRGLQLAQAFPKLEVIEIDLPDVVEEKKKRLQHVANLQLPPNLSWRSADLGRVPLSEVLEGRLANIISAEGLLPYFEFSEMIEIGRQVYRSLKPKSIFITDVGYTTAEGARESGQVMSIFRRQTRTTPGSFRDENTPRQLFADAGYQEVTLHKMPEIAEMFNLPTPAPDVLFFMVARKVLGNP